MGRVAVPEVASAPVAPPPAVVVEAPAAASASEVSASGVDAVVVPPAAPPADAAAAPAKGERAKIAAAKAIADAARYRQERARQATRDAELQRAQAEIAQLRARTIAFDELESLSKTDKIAAAHRLGLSPREIADAALKEGTPEHAAKTLRAEIAAEFEAKYGSKLKEQQAFIEQMTRSQQAAAVQQAESALTARAADATAYPNLADLPPLVVLELVRKITRDMAPEQAAVTTHEDLLAFLEHTTAEHRKSRSAASSSAASTVSASNGGPANTRAQTNGAASGTTDELPKDWDSWSDSRQRRWMAAQIDKSRAATTAKAK